MGLGKDHMYDIADVMFGEHEKYDDLKINFFQKQIIINNKRKSTSIFQFE